MDVDPAPQIELVHVDGTAVVRLTGEIDMYAVPPILRAGTSLLQGTPRRPLIIDMSGVTFLDSSGISCLLRLDEEASAALTEMRIRNPSKAVCKVLDIAGLEFATEHTSGGERAAHR